MPKISQVQEAREVWNIEGNFATCRICPKSRQTPIKKSHISSHSTSKVHRQAIENKRLADLVSSRSSPNPTNPHIGAKDFAQRSPSSHTYDHDMHPRYSQSPPLATGSLQTSVNFDFNLDLPDDSGGSDHAGTSGSEDEEDKEVPISQLWRVNDGDREILSPGDERLGNHQTVLERLQRGEKLFPDFTFDDREEIPDDGRPTASAQDRDTDSSSSETDEPREAAPNPTAASSETEAFPWPSLPMFLTDALFSSPRLQFSESQMKAVLAWAEDLKATNVPKLDALKACQARVRREVGNPTEKKTASDGNVFYLNDIGKAIAKDYANPLTRLSMRDYPEYDGGSMSEVFHGSKMLEDVPDEQLSPTARNDGKIFYVNELLQRKSGAYFIPERYFNRKEGDGSKTLQALGRDVVASNEGLRVSASQVIRAVSTFHWTYEELGGADGGFPDDFEASSISYSAKMPHPMRKLAGGKMVYSVPLIIFMDDVSGNVSKQWNKHYVVYVSNANMPREMIEKEFCLRFVTSSPHASPMQLMQGVKESIAEACKTGTLAWDQLNQEEVILRPYGLLFAGDNPMQAEECSQAGLICNYFCRTCKVGGTKAYKKSDEGFQKLFQDGDPRTPDETKAHSMEHLNLSIQPGATAKIKKAVAANGVKDSLAAPIVDLLINLGKELRVSGANKVEAEEQLQKELDRHLKSNPVNPLIGMPGVNIHLDTPTEVLHTVLLGVVKYFWGQTIFLLKQDHAMDLFQARLASIGSDGLNIPKINAEYICAYSGSLIGKHFKSLAQVMSFLVYDLVPKSVLTAWNIIGDLVVLLWHTKIDDIEVYCAKLSRVIEDFLNITAQCAPSILISKPKFHFLVHLPAYIRRFGPAITFSTERYESFNSVFRQTCIYSNRQAPSRDTCTKLASQDIIKHVATGGFWLSPSSKKWVCASETIIQYTKSSPHISRLLNIPQKPIQKPTGSARLPFAQPAPPVDPQSSAAQSMPRGGLISRVGKSVEEKARLDTQLAQRKARTVQRLGIAWSKTICAGISGVVLNANGVGGEVRFIVGRSFIGHAGESISQTGHAILDRGNNDNPCIVRILEILIPASVGGPLIASHIAVERMGFRGLRHPRLDMPCLDLTGSRLVVSPKDVLQPVNVQHDCDGSGCNGLQHIPTRQEWSVSRKTRTVITHKESGMYVLNTHALHNYQAIASIVPQHLLGSSVTFDDVVALRLKAALYLRNKKEEADATAAQLKKSKLEMKAEAQHEGGPTQIASGADEVEMEVEEPAFQKKGRKKGGSEVNKPKAPLKPRKRAPVLSRNKGKGREIGLTIVESLDEA